MRVDVDEDEKSARVVVPDLQLSLAIGKEGQNVRLAAKLTGWKIDIKCESQIRAVIEAELLNFNSNTETTALYDDDDENMSKELEELLSIDNKQPSAPSNLSLEDLFLNLDDIDKNDDKESEDE